MFRSILTALLITTPAFAQVFEMTPEVAAAREAYIAGDYGSALTVLRPAAEAGDAIAQNILAAAYERGAGVAVDLEAARAWWLKSAEQGYVKAAYNMGWFLNQRAEGYPNDPAAALPWVEAAMAQDYAEAFYLRAEMHEGGRGGRRDMEAAGAAYDRAAKLGNVDAMNELGILLLYGEEGDQNLPYAFDLFQQAARAGDPLGLSNLGAMYEYGYGVGQDVMAAMALYRRAAELGDPQGAVNLGLVLTFRDSAWQDPVEGLTWCFFGQEHADADDVEGFTEDCDRIAATLTAEQYERAAAGLVRLRP